MSKNYNYEYSFFVKSARQAYSPSTLKASRNTSGTRTTVWEPLV